MRYTSARSHEIPTQCDACDTSSPLNSDAVGTGWTGPLGLAHIVLTVVLSFQVQRQRKSRVHGQIRVSHHVICTSHQFLTSHDSRHAVPTQQRAASSCQLLVHLGTASPTEFLPKHRSCQFSVPISTIREVSFPWLVRIGLSE